MTGHFQTDRENLFSIRPGWRQSAPVPPPASAYYFGRINSSGNLAMLAAIRRASSRASKIKTAVKPGPSGRGFSLPRVHRKVSRFAQFDRGITHKFKYEQRPKTGGIPLPDTPSRRLTRAPQVEASNLRNPESVGLLGVHFFELGVRRRSSEAIEGRRASRYGLPLPPKTRVQARPHLSSRRLVVGELNCDNR
jgi:hypothetical protein